MAAENNYEEILEEVCEKLNNIDMVKELDVLEIKNSVETIENLITDTQAKLNFEEIKEKLENIALQVDSCNDALLKDLYNDINALKDSTSSVSQHLENLQNVQNLALTSAEFEEYQKQQLDLALKTNENIFNELAALKENALPETNSESIKNLETQLTNLHQTLTSYIEQMATKIEAVPNLDDIGSIMADLNSVQQKNIKQTNTILKDVQTKLASIQEESSNKEIENQLAKIGEIYDSLGIINAWIEKVGYINQSIENVYARLGESIDFDDVAEKVEIIYQNIDALNTWTRKIDSVDGNVLEIQSKIGSLTQLMHDTKNISNVISSIKDKVDASLSEDLDFEDLVNKMDIVYENISTINEWASKVDVISDKITTINTAFEDEMISSKIDLVYENIGLLNEWVSKIDGYADANKSLNVKVDEITETLSKASKIIDDVPNLKDRLEDLSSELHAITRSTKDDAESYIYTLLDIESDFLKLHKFLDDKTNVTTQDINSLKEKFSELNDDISSISIRTNKLILSADDANKEFKTYLEAFKSAIYALDVQRKEFNPELKFTVLGEKINEMVRLLHNSVNATRNLNSAFVYLAEWVDATGVVLNTMQTDIAELKGKNENPLDFLDSPSDVKDGINGLVRRIADLEDTFASFRNDDVSEIKSLLTGIIVQLNTALTPDIDSLTERIDKLSEENNSKFTELESLMQEKINQQSKQIIALEEKIETLNGKFDKLIEAMSEEHKNYEIKDILNYIATQISATNESIANQQNAGVAINDVVQKISNLDSNINKIVSYIEED